MLREARSDLSCIGHLSPCGGVTCRTVRELAHLDFPGSPTEMTAEGPQTSRRSLGDLTTTSVVRGPLYMCSALALCLPEERRAMLSPILLIVVILLLIAVLPTWPYSAGWGYYPSGGLGLILLIILILLVLGAI
jgi:Protein of unknown function (DUF3309)